MADKIEEAAQKAWRETQNGRKQFLPKPFKAGFKAGYATAQAELAAANTRIAELEGERQDWERLARNIALRLSDYHQRDIRESVARIHAALGEDKSGGSDTEQQEQQINAAEGEEH